MIQNLQSCTLAMLKNWDKSANKATLMGSHAEILPVICRLISIVTCLRKNYWRNLKNQNQNFILLRSTGGSSGILRSISVKRKQIYLRSVRWNSKEFM